MRISDEEFDKLYRTPLKDIPVPVMFSLMGDQQDLRNQLKIAKAALEFYAQCGCESNDGFTNRGGTPLCDPEEHCHECHAREALEQLK